MTSPAFTPAVGVDVAGLAESAFDAVIEHFKNAGVDLPARQIMAPGAPEQIAWDCPQLVMTLSGIGLGAAPGQSGGPRQPAHFAVSVVRHVVLTWQLVRCVPEPNDRGVLPTPATLRAAALQQWRDAGLISHALTTVAGQIKNSLPPGALVEAGAVAPIGPEGGHAGLQTSLTVTAANLV